MIKSDTVKFGRPRSVIEKAGRATVIDVIVNDIAIAKLSNNSKHVPVKDGPWDILLADNTHVGRKLGLDTAKAHLYECLQIDPPTVESEPEPEPEQPVRELIEPEKRRRRPKDKRWLDDVLPQLKTNDSIAIVGCKGSLAPSIFYDMQLVIRDGILYLLNKKGIFQSWYLSDVDYYQNMVNVDVVTIESKGN